MKKSLLMLSMALLALTANAQTQRTTATRVQNAENLPTALRQGFEFKFKGGRQDNCLSLVLPGTNDHWSQIFGDGNGTAGFNAGYSVNLDSTNHNLIVNADGTANSIFAARLPVGDCSSMYGASASDRIDLSVDKRVSITLTSSVDVAKFMLFPAVLTGAGYDYVDGHSTDPVNSLPLTAGVATTLTFHVSTKNYAGTVMPLDKMIGIAFFARTAADASVVGTFTISSIKIGDAVTTAVPTATQNANVVNDQVSLFPNPAKGSFHVDVTAMNNSDAASVKVMNANGLVVKEFSSNLSDIEIATEGMNKGIYMVQVTSGNKIATKKVVVE